MRAHVMMAAMAVVGLTAAGPPDTPATGATGRAEAEVEGEAEAEAEYRVAGEAEADADDPRRSSARVDVPVTCDWYYTLPPMGNCRLADGSTEQHAPPLDPDVRPGPTPRRTLLPSMGPSPTAPAAPADAPAASARTGADLGASAGSGSDGVDATASTGLRTQPIDVQEATGTIPTPTTPFPWSVVLLVPVVLLGTGAGAWAGGRRARAGGGRP